MAVGTGVNVRVAAATGVAVNVEPGSGVWVLKTIPGVTGKRTAPGSSVMVGIGAVKIARSVERRVSPGTELVDSRMISSMIFGSIGGTR